MLNKFWVGSIDDDVDKIIKTKFKHGSNENYPKDILHKYADNSDNCKYPLAITQVAPNQKQTNRAGLVKLIKIKTGVKVTLTINIDIKEHLINKQARNIWDTEFAQGSAPQVYGMYSR